MRRGKLLVWDTERKPKTSQIIKDDICFLLSIECYSVVSLYQNKAVSRPAQKEKFALAITSKVSVYTVKKAFLF